MWFVFRALPENEPPLLPFRERSECESTLLYVLKFYVWFQMIFLRHK
ncbi:MAG: hypothetical protein U5L45_23470 [Saprospiraceae bacterium]|nr:hypothetical protein [Saprospiraceae bacterium]